MPLHISNNLQWFSGIAVDEQESSGSSGGETSCSGSNTDNSSTDNSTNNDNAKDTAAQALIKSVATRKRRLIEGVPIPTKRSRMLESVNCIFLSQSSLGKLF